MCCSASTSQTPCECCSLVFRLSDWWRVALSSDEFWVAQGTALNYAARTGHKDVVVALLDAGASPTKASRRATDATGATFSCPGHRPCAETRAPPLPPPAGPSVLHRGGYPRGSVSARRRPDEPRCPHGAVAPLSKPLTRTCGEHCPPLPLPLTSQHCLLAPAAAGRVRGHQAPSPVCYHVRQRRGGAAGAEGGGAPDL